MTAREDMERDWRRDQQDQRTMGDVALAIERFLRTPPFRCSARSRYQLQEAADALREDCAVVVRVWD